LAAAAGALWRVPAANMNGIKDINSRGLGLALIIVCCCVPLFVGLGRGDLWGDEAAHSFSVDRMLESGDWLAPKSSPQENDVFLEKPPLKFWIVAAPIRLGVLPHDEFGLRFWDALFGSLAFLYVYAIGCRLAGAVCGVASVLTLFAFWPLLFDHGLRGNNMEASLLLCYCGGVYHFFRANGEAKTLAARPLQGRVVAWNALAVALYFVLGFMTKFVAALFLPLVLGAAVLFVPAYRREFARHWQSWLAAGAVAIALIAPWFVYAQMRFGRRVWDVMLGSQVYTRLTTYLNPAQVQPWPFYWVNLYKSFSYAGAAAVIGAGVLLLLVQTVRRRWPDGWVILFWGLMPIFLISFGASKLIHYAYPFVPPFALAGGYLTSMVVMLAPAPLARVGWPRVLMVVVALAAVVLVGETMKSGEASFSLAGHVLFRSSGVFRPLVGGLIAVVLASRGRSAPRVAAALSALVLVPLPAYAQNLSRLEDSTATLRTMRDCLNRVETISGHAGLYVDVADDEMEHHVYYYFRTVRPWTRADSSAPVRIQAYRDSIATQQPMVVSARRYQELLGAARQADGGISGLPPAVTMHGVDVKILLPGPYAACGSAP
jgi:4-amino-4-deoxy-L-arabinose transferase-like glycosyltransferase